MKYRRARLQAGCHRAWSCSLTLCCALLACAENPRLDDPVRDASPWAETGQITPVLSFSDAASGAEPDSRVPPADAGPDAARAGACDGIGCPCADDGSCVVGACAADDLCREPCNAAGECAAASNCCGGFCYAETCVTTLVGRGVGGAPDAPLAEAYVNGVYDLQPDGKGNAYFTEWMPGGVRLINRGATTLGRVAAGTVGRVTSGIYGCKPGLAAEAEFRHPVGLALDGAGNLYVADLECRVIWKIDEQLQQVSVLAGAIGDARTLDGKGEEARLREPWGLTFGTDGKLYFSDTRDHLIRRVSLDGEVETVAGIREERGVVDGPALQAQFDSPHGLVMDEAGRLYVGDYSGGAVRMIEGLTAGGEVSVTTISGPQVDDGKRLGNPGHGALTVRDPGSKLYVNFWSNGVWSLTPGEGGWEATQLYGRAEMLHAIVNVLDPADPDVMWVGGWVNSSSPATSWTNTIKRFDLTTSKVLSVVGKPTVGKVTSGPADQATFNFARCSASMTIDDDGDLWVAEHCSHVVRKITPAGEVSTIGSGTYGELGGTSGEARFCYPSAIVANGEHVYVVNRRCKSQVSRIERSSGAVALLGQEANKGSTCVPGEPSCPVATAHGGAAVDSDGALVVAVNWAYSAGNSEKYASGWDGMPMLVKVPDKGAGTPAFFAGTPNNSRNPEQRNSCFDGPLGEGQFGQWPHQLAIDRQDQIYVADTRCGVRKVSPEGAISTITDEIKPIGIAYGEGPVGETLYVSKGDEVYHVDPVTGTVGKLAGLRDFLYDEHHRDGALLSARFWAATSLAVAGGRLYVLDRGNNRIRVVLPAPPAE